MNAEKQAVSLSKFRAKLFPFFDIMKETGITVEVYHRRKIYELTIRPTNRRVTTPYRRRRGNKEGIDKVPYEVCECGELKVGGICMAKQNHQGAS